MQLVIVYHFNLSYFVKELVEGIWYKVNHLAFGDHVINSRTLLLYLLSLLLLILLLLA